MSTARRDVGRVLEELTAYLAGETPPLVTQLASQSKPAFHLLVATVLSSRTKDDVTGPAARRLLARAGTPRALARLSEAKIARLIYPAGFYRTKARQLRALGRALEERHGGRVPPDMEALLSLPGVGRKTAALVLNTAFAREVICVDTHVHRISNRLGWVSTQHPHQTERALMQLLPRSYWIPVNMLLVRFGQSVCTPVSPFCSRCPVRSHCPQIGVARRR
jgi:endonuclease-3